MRQFFSTMVGKKEGKREDIIADYNLYNLSSVKLNQAKYPQFHLPPDISYPQMNKLSCLKPNMLWYLKM